MTSELPRENLVRALPGGFTLRADEGDGTRTLFGHFARFNEWTEIDSAFEGHFLERIAPGAFQRTFENDRDRFRLLFQHGRDPQVGDKPIAKVTELREDSAGAYYEGDLLDTSYVRDLIPGLEAGVYGASFRFRVIAEDVVNRPERSDDNPDGLPERTIREAEVMEAGPVTFPAYAGATAGVRSLTDEFVVGRMVDADPKHLAEVIQTNLTTTTTSAGQTADTVRTTPANPPTTAPRRIERKEQTGMDLDKFTSVETLSARLDELNARQTYLDQEWTGRQFDDATKAEWEDIKTERAAIKARIAHFQERAADIAAISQKTETVETVVPERTARPEPFQTTTRKSDNIYDLGQYRGRSDAEERAGLRDGAMRAIEVETFGVSGMTREAAQERVARLLDTVQGQDGSGTTALARRILATGSPIYKRAFGKYLADQARTPEEAAALEGGTERALSLTGASGGFAVPFTLDPTILGTSNREVNPIRALARVENITGDEWRGVTSAGITTAYAAEATETTDNAPALVQPTVSTEKAQAFIPYSIEVGMDWDGLQAEMGRLLTESKDDLEAVKFTTGTGTNEPFGVITGATNTVNATAAGVFSLANLYALQAALPPRYRPRASFLANLAILQKVRQFDTAGGAALWETLANAEPDRLLGRPVYENSAMTAVTTVGALFLLYGDFSRYLIADRIGLTVETIPHLFGTNHRPTGQRGLYAYWRNGAKVLDANAFRVLIGLA